MEVLHSGDDNCRSRVGQVSQCRRERGVRGLEAVRDGMGAQVSDEVCGTPDERAGVQIPRRHSNQAGGVRENRNQSTKTVDDDIKMGVTMLGMEDMRVKEHLIRNSVRITITSWNQMREEILAITRTQQHIDSQPMPMQLGANPKSKSKGTDSKGKGKGKGKDVKGKDKAKDAKNESSKKAKSDDQRKCFCCQKTGPRERRVQKATERPCRCKGETDGRDATSKRHSSDRAVAVLTPRRETHVNVRHSHAMCEQRNVLRVFQ